MVTVTLEKYKSKDGKTTYAVWVPFRKYKVIVCEQSLSSFPVVWAAVKNKDKCKVNIDVCVITDIKRLRRNHEVVIYGDCSGVIYTTRGSLVRKIIGDRNKLIEVNYLTRDQTTTLMELFNLETGSELQADVGVVREFYIGVTLSKGKD